MKKQKNADKRSGAQSKILILSENRKNSQNPNLQSPPNSQTQNNQKSKIWKWIAISVVFVFILFIVIGLIRNYHFRSSFVKPTQAQIGLATQIATEKLQSSGGNATDFKIKVNGKMPKPRYFGNEKPLPVVLQVLFYKNATSHAYLVDITSKEVLMHSQTEFFKGFPGNFRLNKADEKSRPEPPEDIFRAEKCR